MRSGSERASTQAASLRTRRSCPGFTLMELMVAVAVMTIMLAAATPVIQSTIAYFQLRSAVSAVTGAVQTTRYQAISNGYKFRVAFDPTTRTYQVSSDPTGTGTFTNSGGAMSFGGSLVNMANSATLEFSPSGSVSLVAGQSPVVLNCSGKTGTITVTTYGNINVTYG